MNKTNDSPIYVTRPLLPPLNEFIAHLENIWRSGWLTNGGQYHQLLEEKLAAYLGVEHLCLFANATIALMTALKVAGVSGEVITTPYSFAATAHSLLWNGVQPVFVDIRDDDFNIDVDAVEAAITPATSAILPVHCYGNPCDVRRLGRVAERHGLQLIYDAAHAFGNRVGGRSLLAFGDLSVISFHATKVFTTFEGGAIVCPDARTKQRIDQWKNFGLADEVSVVVPGLNGKMNELQAAFGLVQLGHVDAAIERRLQIDRLYRTLLEGVPGVRLPLALSRESMNGSYFAIRIAPPYPLSRDALYDKLKAARIFARRYFYPLLSDMPMYRTLPSARAPLPHARAASQEVLCLPIHACLTDAQVAEVVRIVREAGSDAATAGRATHHSAESASAMGKQRVAAK
jgi:dTDP-4-amino-4,6-dideoxy-D-glucose transaminase